MRSVIARISASSEDSPACPLTPTLLIVPPSGIFIARCGLPNQMPELGGQGTLFTLGELAQLAIQRMRETKIDRSMGLGRVHFSMPVSFQEIDGPRYTKARKERPGCRRVLRAKLTQEDLAAIVSDYSSTLSTLGKVSAVGFPAVSHRCQYLSMIGR